MPKSATSRGTKKVARAIGPADLTAEELYDGAQWHYYKWLAHSELAGIQKAPRREPEPGEI